MALVQGFVVKMYQVPSGSMEQTLSTGQMIFVNRNAGTAERGEVWVFNASEHWRGVPKPTVDGPKNLVRWGAGALGYGPGLESALVKRVIGTGGDEVACCDVDGRLTVNGEPIDEPYIFEDYSFEPGALDCSTEPMSQRCFGPIHVPEGGYLMLGDHRGNSADSVSRCRGIVSDAVDEGCARFASNDDLVGQVIGVS